MYETVEHFSTDEGEGWIITHPDGTRERVFSDPTSVARIKEAAERYHDALQRLAHR